LRCPDLLPTFYKGMQYILHLTSALRNKLQLVQIQGL
jgi:hypothetical protein